MECPEATNWATRCFHWARSMFLSFPLSLKSINILRWGFKKKWMYSPRIGYSTWYIIQVIVKGMKILSSLLGWLFDHLNTTSITVWHFAENRLADWHLRNPLGDGYHFQGFFSPSPPFIQMYQEIIHALKAASKDDSVITVLTGKTVS